MIEKTSLSGRSIVSQRMQQMHPNYSRKDLDAAVQSILELIIDSLVDNKRVEVRGFGSFSLRRYESRMGRNPSSGEALQLKPRYSVYFRAGKALREVMVQAGKSVRKSL